MRGRPPRKENGHQRMTGFLDARARCQQEKTSSPWTFSFWRSAPGTHSLLATLFIVCMTGVDKLTLVMNDGHEIMIADTLKLSYLFQGFDVALIAVFGIYGVI